MSIERPLKELLNRLQISGFNPSPIPSKEITGIDSSIRLLPLSRPDDPFMSVSIEEASGDQGAEHIVEIECLVHQAGIPDNIGGRMVMPSNSTYATHFTYDSDLAITVGIRSGALIELIHVNAASLGKQGWGIKQQVQIVFTLSTH